VSRIPTPPPLPGVKGKPTEYPEKEKRPSEEEPKPKKESKPTPTELKPSQETAWKKLREQGKRERLERALTPLSFELGSLVLQEKGGKPLTPDQFAKKNQLSTDIKYIEKLLAEFAEEEKLGQETEFE
jgi:hypothetical protein